MSILPAGPGDAGDAGRHGPHGLCSLRVTSLRPGGTGTGRGLALGGRATALSGQGVGVPEEARSQRSPDSRARRARGRGHQRSSASAGKGGSSAGRRVASPPCSCSTGGPHTSPHPPLTPGQEVPHTCPQPCCTPHSGQNWDGLSSPELKGTPGGLWGPLGAGRGEHTDGYYLQSLSFCSGGETPACPPGPLSLVSWAQSSTPSL